MKIEISPYEKFCRICTMRLVMPWMINMLAGFLAEYSRPLVTPVRVDRAHPPKWYHACVARARGLLYRYSLRSTTTPDYGRSFVISLCLK